MISQSNVENIDVRKFYTHQKSREVFSNVLQVHIFLAIAGQDHEKTLAQIPERCFYKASNLN